MMLKFALLGFLSYRPMTGYDLDAWISASTGNFWHAKLSQIYTTLKKLESEGLVTAHTEPGEGRPDRRVYTLTEIGRADLLAWLKTPIVEPIVKKDELLLKVFFGLPAGKTALLTQMRLQLELHRQQQAHYQQDTPAEISDILEEQPELRAHALLWDLTRRFGEMYEETYIRWLEEAIAMLEHHFPDE